MEGFPLGSQARVPRAGEAAIATTKIWDIKGVVGKTLLYIENHGKTENPAFQPTAMTEADIQSMEDVMEFAMTDERAKEFNHVIEYAADGRKTEQQHFVTSLNCDLESAREDMLITKNAWRKTDGISAFHGIQSFKPGEVTPDIAHEIGIKLAQEIWGDRFEVVIATHLDKNHVHTHFVLNSVSFKDGYKFYDNKQTYRKMRDVSDRLCKEYNLSVIQNPKRGKTKQYAEWQAEKQNQPTWRGMIKADVDEAISQSMLESHFVAKLQKRGYEVKLGKDISVRPPGKERFFRLERNFGEKYSRDGIIRQMRGRRPTFPEPKTNRNAKAVKFKGNLKPIKLTGFQALYYHYLYLLGKLPRKRPKPPSQVRFIFREDWIKINRICEEMKLLSRNKIDTAEQLSSYKGGLAKKIDTLTDERANLRKQLRRAKDEPAKDELKAKISILSKALGGVRKEVRLCDDIADRSEQIRKKKQIASEERKQEQITRKEKYLDEPFR